jgi:hypothetical protein
MIIGDGGKKDEDVILYVSQRLREISKKFKDIYDKYGAEEGIKALAVYIACYYHHRNDQLVESFAKVRSITAFKDFASAKEANFESENKNAIDMRSYEIYEKVIHKSEEYGSK